MTSTLHQHNYDNLDFYLSSKCQQYSPTEATKAYEKAPTRKQGVVFNPEFIITLLKSESHETKLNRSKTECLDIYFQVCTVDRTMCVYVTEDFIVQFKSLLNSLDPFDHEEDDSDDKDNLPAAHVQNVQDHPTDVKVLAINTDDLKFIVTIIIKN